MRKPTVVCRALALMLVASLMPLAAGARQEEGSALIAADLRARLQAEGRASFFVLMSAEADLSAAFGMDWQARGEYVSDALDEVARVTQQPVLDLARDRGLDVQSFAINNSVYVRDGTLADAQALAALPGVAGLYLERVATIPEPAFEEMAEPAGTAAPIVDWGLNDTKARNVWSLGYRGAGIVVASIDTGVDYQHPALFPNYKCGNGPHAACWFDPNVQNCVFPRVPPCDTNGHGTHTMGTMAASDAANLPYTVGMAPSAQWITCLGCPNNVCPEADLVACANWMLKPNGDPGNRPQVVNNSWNFSNECYENDGGWNRRLEMAWWAAGIFPSFSAGNEGPYCGTLRSPADYQESFANAAHDKTRAIADFSSRGPACTGQGFGHDPNTKPNLSAPGVGVVSTLPNNTWGKMNGTSMASPHTAGAVALIWSASAVYAGQVEATFQLLQKAAEAPPAGNCSAPPDGEGNYTYGYGFLNALAAVQKSGGGRLQGKVTNEQDQPQAGANLWATWQIGMAGWPRLVYQTQTDAGGEYAIDPMVPGKYSVFASKNNVGYALVLWAWIHPSSTTYLNLVLHSWKLGSPPGGFGRTRFDGEYFPATGRIYFLGGAYGSTTLGQVLWFDPAAQTWGETGAVLPIPITDYTASLVNDGSRDLICAFGGRDSAGSPVPVVQCYDPLANSAFGADTMWMVCPGYLPGGQVVLDNKVYLFGGLCTASPYTTAATFRYDPVTHLWLQMGDMTLGRGYIMAAAVDGKVYAFGGDTSNGTSLFAQTRAEVLDPATGQWNDAAVADLPVASGQGRAFGLDGGSRISPAGLVILAGGGQWPGETADALVYDVAGDTYDESFPDLNQARRDHAAAMVPASRAESTEAGLWVFGGRQGSDNPPYPAPEFMELSQPQPLLTLHLFQLKLNWGSAPPNYKLVASGSVHDGDHVRTEGVSVLGAWTYPDGMVVAGSAVTDALGRFKFRAKSGQCGLYRFDVTGMNKAGYEYDPAANHVPPHLEVTIPCER